MVFFKNVIICILLIYVCIHITLLSYLSRPRLAEELSIVWKQHLLEIENVTSGLRVRRNRRTATPKNNSIDIQVPCGADGLQGECLRPGGLTHLADVPFCNRPHTPEVKGRGE